MKRLLFCLPVLLFVLFGAAPTQALIGIPDDVPGRDILVPFFYVSIPKTNSGSDNTIITITEVKGELGVVLKYTMYDKIGHKVHDNNIFFGSGYDVISMDLNAIIATELSAANKDQLQFDSDSDGEADHWIGYIWIERIYDETIPNSNNLVSQVYQVDVNAGRAVSYNAPRLEYSSFFVDDRQRFSPGADIEAFSANALYIGKLLLERGINPATANDASFLRMIFRYQIQNKRSQNLLIIWVDHDSYVSESITARIFNEEAYFMSVSMPIHTGLNILDLANYIPETLHDSSEYPKAGFIDINLSASDDDDDQWEWDANQSWLGYSWQRCSGKASKNAKPIFSPGRSMWDVIQPADRETDDVPSF
jgi:hypothetical protein